METSEYTVQFWRCSKIHQRCCCFFAQILSFFYFSYNTPAQAPAIDYADADEVDTF